MSLLSRASPLLSLAARSAPRAGARQLAPAARFLATAIYPDDRKYKSSHEWVKMSGDVATVGITDHAQGALGEIVFADLPDAGTEFAAGDGAAAVESVKAAGEIYAPLAGEVTETNAHLEDQPALINSNAHDDGWLFKMKVTDTAEFDTLLSVDDYIKTLPAKE